MIEEALRKSFAARVATPPVPADPAGAAIRRGRSRRLRRTLGSGATVLVLFTGLLTGAVVARRAWISEQNAQRGTAPAAAPSAVEAAPLAVLDGPMASTPAPSGAGGSGSASRGRAATDPDVRVGNQIWTAGGARLELPVTGTVNAVYRVPAGWVYSADDDLRLLRQGRGWLPLVAKPDGWTLSADGERLAYVAARRLTIGELSDRGLSVRVSVPIPAGITPVAFAGERLVIARDGQFDFMNVGGAYTPTWSTTVVTVYGARSGLVAGLIRSGSAVCLAELGLKPAGLAVQRVGSCRFKTAAALGARLSPDGAWLAIPGSAGVSLVDLEKSFAAGRTGAKPVKADPAVITCPGLSDPPPAWLSASTLATADRIGPLRCHTDGSTDPADLPGGAGAGWSYVPMLAGA